jgi:hypothetical protein
MHICFGGTVELKDKSWSEKTDKTNDDFKIYLKYLFLSLIIFTLVLIITLIFKNLILFQFDLDVFIFIF